MYKDNIGMIKEIVPNIEDIAFDILGCDIDNIETETIIIPDDLIKQISSYKHEESKYVLIDKLTHWCLADLNSFYECNKYPLLGENAISSLRDYIYDGLYAIFFRTQVYDFNKSKLEFKELSFADYEARFDDYNFLHVFFKRYPALFKSLITYKNKNIYFIDRLLQNYHKDIGSIKKSMGFESVVIDRICAGMGDSHNNGYSVTLLHIGDNKLIYKPVNGAVNHLYSCIANHFSSSCDIKIYTPLIIQCDTYHWCEYVNFKPCTTPEEINYFYKSIGAQLMLIYALNGSDFHYENIIAMGKHPVFIDMECLFSRFKEEEDENILFDSVITTSIIPVLSGNKASKYVSAISVVDKENNSFSNLIATNDDGYLYIDKQSISFRASKNNPYLGEDLVTAEKYIDSITLGFRTAWKYVTNEADYIHNQIKKHAAEIEIRKLYNGTSFYSRLLSMSYHPRFLMDDTSRFIFLLSGISSRERGCIAKKSHEALLNGDIPFHTLCLSDIYHTVDGKTISLVEQVNEKIKALDEEELLFQEKIIHLSINTLIDGGGASNKSFHSSQSGNDTSGLEVVVSVFDAILKSNYKGKFLNNRWDINSFTQMNGSIYNGTGGLAFTSICLYIATNEMAYLEKAVDLINDSISTSKMPFGAFLGRGSNIYLLELVYHLTNDKKYLIRAIDEACANIECSPSLGSPYEFLNGHAGCLSVCLNLLQHERENEILLSAINLHLRKIISGAYAIDDSKISWDTGMTGFAHGNAGVIYALSCYMNYFEESKKGEVMNALCKAVNYENSFKSYEGWRGLREEGIQEKDSMFWCNGAPGIALSRKKIMDLRILDVDHDIELAKTLIEKQLWLTDSTSLCHSHLSNMIIYDKITNGVGREELKAKVNAALFKLDTHFIHREIINYNCDISLMTGICGLLYAYLYLNYSVPFVLTLDTIN